MSFTSIGVWYFWKWMLQSVSWLKIKWHGQNICKTYITLSTTSLVSVWWMRGPFPSTKPESWKVRVLEVHSGLSSQEGLNAAFWPKALHRFDLQYHVSTSTLGCLQMHVVKWCSSQANNWNSYQCVTHLIRWACSRSGQPTIIVERAL